MVKKQTKVSKAKDTVQQKNENVSRKAVLEDLFYDFHRSRTQVYVMNFMRGIFFGLGSTLGATVVLAIIVWVLSQFTGIVPGLNDVVDTVKHE